MHSVQPNAIQGFVDLLERRFIPTDQGPSDDEFSGHHKGVMQGGFVGEQLFALGCED